jgi:hypothetical protein
MMMLTIHTFMAIITADNYMDETFFHCNRISVLSSCVSSAFFASYVNTHFGLRSAKSDDGAESASKKRRTRAQREIADTTGDRRTEFYL